jgi:predicted aldo/keto reductase-like oxidoreductase
MERMKYRILGKTGLRVSLVGLGGIPLQRIDADRTRDLIDFLEAAGVNFIDSARGYTVSEAYIGAALSGRREKFILATKSTARTYGAMQEDIEISLKNFQTDYIDLYQLHNVPVKDFDTVFGENGAAAAIRQAICEGKVGHLGATAHSVEAFAKLLEYPEIESVMFPYNIVETQGKDIMKQARKKNVGFIAMKPLAGGNIEDGRLAIRFILHDEDCTLALPGMATVAEAAENIGAVYDLSLLTAEEEEKIEAVRARLSGNFCRRCGYCAPCTAGIDIPICLIWENYAAHYQLTDWATSRYRALAAHAGDCIGCGECEARCPYHLPIREKMKSVKSMFGY